MNHTYQTTNKTNTTQTTKTTTSTSVLPPTQSLYFYNWDNSNSRVFIFKFQPISKNSYSTNFVHFVFQQFVHFINPEKPVRGLMSNFLHFIHPYMNPLATEHFIHPYMNPLPYFKQKIHSSRLWSISLYAISFHLEIFHLHSLFLPPLLFRTLE